MTLRQTEEDGYNLRMGTTPRQMTMTLRQTRNNIEVGMYGYNLDGDR